MIVGVFFWSGLFQRKLKNKVKMAISVSIVTKILSLNEKLKNNIIKIYYQTKFNF